MAQRYEVRDITIPAGTTQASPQVTNLVWRQGYPERVEIRFPPGPSGLVGVQLRHSGRVVIPFRSTDFIIADNEVIDWTLENYPYSPAWSVRAFNIGVYEHTIQIRMGLNEVGRVALTPVQPLALAQTIQASGTQYEGAGV